MTGIHHFLMKSNAALTRKILARAAKELSLSKGQPKILEYLYYNGEENQKTIALNCEIEQQTVGSILLRMEKQGLIKRRQKDGNRRSLHVSLTDKGKEVTLRLTKILREEDEKALKNLTKEEVETLKRLLNTVSATLKDREDDK